jgi:hypothetical protein
MMFLEIIRCLAVPYLPFKSSPGCRHRVPGRDGKSLGAGKRAGTNPSRCALLVREGRGLKRHVEWRAMKKDRGRLAEGQGDDETCPADQLYTKRTQNTQASQATGAATGQNMGTGTRKETGQGSRTRRDDRAGTSGWDSAPSTDIKTGI